MARFKEAQIWKSTDTYTEDYLSVLSDLDNDDKHRFGCQITLTPCRLSGFPRFLWVSPPVERSYDHPWTRVGLDKPLPEQHVIVDLEDNILPIVSCRDISVHLLDLQATLFADTYRLIQFMVIGKDGQKRKT